MWVVVVVQEVSRLGEARAGLRVGEYKLLLNEWDVNATAYDEQDMGPQLFVDKYVGRQGDRFLSLALVVRIVRRPGTGLHGR